VGAAIHAAALTSDNQDTHLLDVTPLTLRIGVAGGLAETIIEANTPIPIEQTRAFTTFQDYQETVKLRVYQGESRLAEDNEMLGEFAFSGFETGRRGEVRIDVIFSINTDGIVEVTAMDPATGVKASTELTLSSGLSQDEIQHIMEVGRANDVITETAIGSVNLVKMPSQQVMEAPSQANQAPEELLPLPSADDQLELADDLNLDDLAGGLDLDAATEDLGLAPTPTGGLELEAEPVGGIELDDFAPDPAIEALIDENSVDFEEDPGEALDLELETGPSSNNTMDSSLLTGDEPELELEVDESDDGLELELDDQDRDHVEIQESRDLLFGDVGEDLSLSEEDEEKPE
jgi:hypothetical protein